MTQGTPVVVGIGGGSASGKTAVARAVVTDLGRHRAVLIPHDAYYRDLSHLPMDERRRVNVDHPASLETDLLVRHLDALLLGRPIEVPVYDYATHERGDDPVLVHPAAVIVVEGILALAENALRARMDLAVYVDVPEEERLRRRLRRDVETRGRTPESVRDDHDGRVQPMHRAFIEPSRQGADLVVTGGGHNDAAIAEVVHRVEQLLVERGYV